MRAPAADSHDVRVDRADARTAGVTWRSLLIGLALIPLNCIWVVQVEIVHYSGHPTCLSIFSNAVFSLLLVMAANAGLRLARPSWALSQGELLTVYIMTALGSSLAAHDLMQMLIPIIPHGFWFATPENGWESLLHPYLPSWLTMGDQTALDGYYEGRTSLLDPRNYRPWLRPLFWWGTHIAVSVFTMLCINVLMRRQWTDNEKLTYPLIQLPVEMTAPARPGLWRHPLLWVGFAGGALLDIYNGIAFLVPRLPVINVKVQDVSARFARPPWNALGWTMISFYPFAIALGYFLTTDVCFSCWFFFLFRKALQVVTAAAGWGRIPGAPFAPEQSWGAWMAFLGLAVWVARDHLRGIWRRAWHAAGPDDSAEALPYRWALLGAAVGVVCLVLFWHATGASIGIILLYVILYLAFSTAIAKMRAEVGPPTHEMGWMATTRMIVSMFGTRALGPRNLVMFCLLHFNNRMYRSHQMPVMLEGLKMAETAGIRARRLAVAMLLAVVLGIVSGYWALLSDAYGQRGAVGTGFAAETYNPTAAWLRDPLPRSPVRVAFMGVGAAVALLLGTLRLRFLHFPFHPAGYALGMVFGIDYVWIPLILAWLLKTLVLRYGGPRIHRAIIPLACGVILGEFAVGSFWSSLSVILHRPMYNFWIF